MTQAEILLVLLSWAQHLSGYPMQPVPPVRFVSHAYLVEHACYKKECNVEGWYNDQGIVYLDEVYRGKLEEGFASSLVVHEFTHYLQHKSGDWDDMVCSKRIRRERDARDVQQRYVNEVLGTVALLNPNPVFCP